MFFVGIELFAEAVVDEAMSWLLCSEMATASTPSQPPWIEMLDQINREPAWDREGCDLHSCTKKTVGGAWSPSHEDCGVAGTSNGKQSGRSPPVPGKALDVSGIWRLRVLASLFSWEGNEGSAARAQPRFT